MFSRAHFQFRTIVAPWGALKRLSDETGIKYSRLRAIAAGVEPSVTIAQRLSVACGIQLTEWLVPMDQNVGGAHDGNRP